MARREIRSSACAFPVWMSPPELMWRPPRSSSRRTRRRVTSRPSPSAPKPPIPRRFSPRRPIPSASARPPRPAPAPSPVQPAQLDNTVLIALINAQAQAAASAAARESENMRAFMSAILALNQGPDPITVALSLLPAVKDVMQPQASLNETIHQFKALKEDLSSPPQSRSLKEGEPHQHGSFTHVPGLGIVNVVEPEPPAPTPVSTSSQSAAPYMQLELDIEMIKRDPALRAELLHQLGVEMPAPVEAAIPSEQAPLFEPAPEHSTSPMSEPTHDAAPEGRVSPPADMPRLEPQPDQPDEPGAHNPAQLWFERLIEMPLEQRRHEVAKLPGSAGCVDELAAAFGDLPPNAWPSVREKLPPEVRRALAGLMTVEGKERTAPRSPEAPIVGDGPPLGT